MAQTPNSNTKTYDVLVIGSGLAGLYFCQAMLNAHPHISIALISKAELQECNSFYAQGGIAASSAEPAKLKAHIEDTLMAGDALSHPDNVASILQEGPQVIENLIACHVQFAQENGQYQLAQEGGHSERRIYYSGDETGKAIVMALKEKIVNHPQVDCYPFHTAINLIKRTQPHQIGHHGEIVGAYILNEPQQTIDTFLANVTVLATGGSGKVYRYTTNPEVATGDGLAMAYRAGARVGNMEFFQFHPTLLYHPTVNNFLISEAVRGEGAILRNADTLEPFMARYAPDKKDLATRDVVARSIFTEIENSKASHVYLDITHQPTHFLQKRFPAIYHTLKSVNIDMGQDYIPVVPAAHYQCGGILTNVDGRTDLNRLYAIGEVAFTGLHGANRLASNSLLEACVTAQKAARDCAALLDEPIKDPLQIRPWYAGSEINPRRASQINAHWRGLRGEMTSYAGIVRTEAGLHDLLQLIQLRKKIVEEYYWQHQITRDLIELRNIILVAELIVKSALLRRESRGGHFREDYPQKKLCARESVLSPDLCQVVPEGTDDV